MKGLVLITVLFIVTMAWTHESHCRQSSTKTKDSCDTIRQTYPVNPEVKGSGAIAFRPIGIFRTPYNQITGAPRQGILQPETKATIEIDKIYRKGLTDLEKFEYIIVLYYFNGIKKWSPIATPPNSKHKFGLFSTRSPRRPNPIGFSVIRLDSVDIEKGILQVRGIDAFDGTPVLDIKPYIPSIDIVQSDKNRKLEKKLGMHGE